MLPEYLILHVLNHKWYVPPLYALFVVVPNFFLFFSIFPLDDYALSRTLAPEQGKR
jgi:hypothetical protein